MKKLQDIYIRDPFILIENGIYYLYGTTDEQAWKGKASGFKVYISKNLEDFEEEVVFSNSDDFWGYEHFWAPEVHKINGTYYMFATFSSGNDRQRCQILSSKSPTGPFVPFDELLIKEDICCLDATFFQDNDKKYTIFCHEWLETKDGEMCIAELDDNLKVKGKYKKLFNASEAPWTREIGEGCYITDGPFIRRLKSGKYIMIWSSNSVNGYAMGMSISDKIDGKWKHLDKPLISQNGGHGMIFEKDGKIYVTYHMPNNPHMAERAHFEEIEERDDCLILKNHAK